MVDAGPILPAYEARRDHVVDALAPYFGRDVGPVTSLPVEQCRAVGVDGPLRLQSITVPDWARQAAVDGRLLVPTECAPVDDWRRVDWWTAAFVLLEGWHERAWERQHGSIHSYSTRLDGWDTRAWERAWVNRIGVFLRSWAGLDTRTPSAELRLSHDVDALRKTVPIRIKQGAMRAAVAAKRRSGSPPGSSLRRFLVGAEDWYTIDALVEIERERGIEATFNLFADPRGPTPLRWLMDPGYRLESLEGQRLLRSLAHRQHVRIGLHPSFDSWDDGALLAEQKGHLERHVGSEVWSVRQHWLRFSWDRTWRAQAGAGLALDATLMFNDRAGFRNSAALEWWPWDAERGRRHSIRAVPCCFMDSHQYDYTALTRDTTVLAATSVISECRSIGGVAELLWHPHTLTDDYGWRGGFDALLDAVAA